MAKQNTTAIGGFSGRLGEIVGYQWNGRWCLRMRPAKVRNPRTEAQQTARARFSGGVQLAARMRQGVNEGLRGTAREAGMTAYNAFVSLNQHAFGMVDGRFAVEYAALRLSTGPVAPVALQSATVGEGNVLNVCFEKNPMRMKANGFDMVHLYVYCPELGDGYLAAAVYRRQGRVSLALNELFAGHELHLYLFVSDTSGRHSETAYGGVVTVVPGASAITPWDSENEGVVVFGNEGGAQEADTASQPYAIDGAPAMMPESVPPMLSARAPVTLRRVLT